jgi:hypothetical protein
MIDNEVPMIDESVMVCNPVELLDDVITARVVTHTGRKYYSARHAKHSSNTRGFLVVCLFGLKTVLTTLLN